MKTIKPTDEQDHAVQLTMQLENQPIQYEGINRLVKSLPECQQLEILEIAHALNIQPGDDIIYNLLVGLGYHKTLLAGIPDQIRQAGVTVVENINHQTGDVKLAVQEAAEAGAKTAMNAAIQSLDTDRIIAAVAAKVGSQIASDRIKRGQRYWTTLANTAVCFLALLSMAGGAGLAWIFKPELSITFTQQLSAAAECSKTGDVLACKLKAQK